MEPVHWNLLPPWQNQIRNQVNSPLPKSPRDKKRRRHQNRSTQVGKLAYLCSELIFTICPIIHRNILSQGFQRFKEANLTMNIKKYEFCRTSLKFLDFVIDKDDLRTDPENNVSAIFNYPTPKKTNQIKRLILLVGWYRKYIKKFSTLSSPIAGLLHGRCMVQTSEAEEACRLSVALLLL